MKDIRILDACCGSRMFWFDKKEPHTTYMDRREEEFEIHKKKINVKPDIVADFRDIIHACAIWTTRLVDLEVRFTTRF